MSHAQKPYTPVYFDTVSNLLYLHSEMCHELGDDYDLLTDYEAKLKEHIFQPDFESAYQRGREDRKNGIDLKTGLLNNIKAICGNEEFKSLQNELQTLFDIIIEKLKDSSLLADFTARYRELYPDHANPDTFYRSGYDERVE